jgi:hypothetical protein
MRFLKTSGRTRPAVSLVLLDWSVRESFHLLHYLSRQTLPRDAFEVILVEYFSIVSPAAQTYADQIDTWIVLDMPESAYYHKHLMYNVGIEFARGDVIMIGDSDAMVQEGFLATIVQAFERDPNIVFHIDQFRNARRDLYPFNFPSFEQVMDAHCINNVGGKTAGIVEPTDPLHVRNYGACMCARRDDLIAIGGADEHIDYLGHICGPYDMTFRLVNAGRRELWSQDTFSYHTWHPGQAGVDNYLGPHDGRHMSTTSLESLLTGRVLPLVENPVIRERRLGHPLPQDDAMARIVRANAVTDWDHALLDGRTIPPCPTDAERPVGQHFATLIFQDGLGFSIGTPPFSGPAVPAAATTALASAAAARQAVDALVPVPIRRSARRIGQLSRLAQLAARLAQKLRHPPGLSAIRRWRTRCQETCAQQPAIRQWEASTDLANLVARVLALTADGQPPSDIAVLNRSSALALRIAGAVGLFPRCRVHVVDTVAAAQALCRDAGPAGGLSICIQGLVYLRHYPILHALVGKQAVVA